MPFPEFLQTIIEMLSLSTFYSECKNECQNCRIWLLQIQVIRKYVLGYLDPKQIGVTRAPCVLQSNIRAAENGVVVVDGRC